MHKDRQTDRCTCTYIVICTHTHINTIKLVTTVTCTYMYTCGFILHMSCLPYHGYWLPWWLCTYSLLPHTHTHTLVTITWLLVAMVTGYLLLTSTHTHTYIIISYHTMVIGYHGDWVLNPHFHYH